ncbi:hypothetical protein GCM10009858_26090 [Terrabacter carboxydivorans]|uniref:Uncharacterized protein n=1 Tax=Terrabacter carboxydivorans TaxID=619730 RepID=A0ABP5YTR5_9MICO
MSRRKSESTGPATLRQAKKKQPEAELGGPLVSMLPECGRCPASVVHRRPSGPDDGPRGLTTVTSRGSSGPFGTDLANGGRDPANRLTDATALPYRRWHDVVGTPRERTATPALEDDKGTTT